MDLVEPHRKRRVELAQDLERVGEDTGRRRSGAISLRRVTSPRNLQRTVSHTASDVARDLQRDLRIRDHAQTLPRGKPLTVDVETCWRTLSKMSMIVGASTASCIKRRLRTVGCKRTSRRSLANATIRINAFISWVYCPTLRKIQTRQPLISVTLLTP